MGYAQPAYAKSLEDFGAVRVLDHCRGRLLERATPVLPYRDAMGCYPVFACEEWGLLHRDIDQLQDDLVSVVLVTDPFGNFRHRDLEAGFDHVRQYKTHLVRDLRSSAGSGMSASTRRNLSKARRRLELEACPSPVDHLETWLELYRGLCRRHRIQGIRAFSENAFRQQLDLPGMVMLRASLGGETVGLHLWLVGNDVAYGHLGATSEAGYRHMAAYALYAFAIEHFTPVVRWLSLGADAGTTGDAAAGLTQFKRRWATGERPVYLCHRILQPGRYEELVNANSAYSTPFFPAYRAGEFT